MPKTMTKYNRAGLRLTVTNRALPYTYALWADCRHYFSVVTPLTCEFSAWACDFLFCACGSFSLTCVCFFECSCPGQDLRFNRSESRSAPLRFDCRVQSGRCAGCQSITPNCQPAATSGRSASASHPHHHTGTLRPRRDRSLESHAQTKPVANARM
jgi:hypothetical protein